MKPGHEGIKLRLDITCVREQCSILVVTNTIKMPLLSLKEILVIEKGTSSNINSCMYTLLHLSLTLKKYTKTVVVDNKIIY